MMNISIEHNEPMRCDKRKIYDYLLNSSTEFIPILNERINIQEYSEKLSIKAHTFWLMDGSLICGMAAVYIKSGINAFITSINVRAQYQNNGLSNILISTIIDEASRQGAQSISLEVHRENKKAVLIYLKHHFEVISQHDDWLTMKRTIK